MGQRVRSVIQIGTKWSPQIMSDWKPSSQYQQIAEANRQYYAKAAQMYEATETCVTDSEAQQALERDLEMIIDFLGKPISALHALDACGGSGNIAIKLLKRGLNVTISDISAELLDMFRSKCELQGFTPKIVNAEIGEFLTKPSDNYDLIVFSSALHHLQNVEQVLTLAFARLGPGGLLFTVFDPTARRSIKMLSRIILWLDYVTFKVLQQTSDLLPSLVRRIRRTFSSNTQQQHISDANLGVLAEYHAWHGIDDIALVERLTQMGLEVIWHARYPGGRYAVTRAIISGLKDATSFKLLLRKKKLQPVQ